MMRILTLLLSITPTCLAIYGGTETVIERRPYMAAISVKRVPAVNCAASIISSKFLLTSLWCNFLVYDNEMWARVGSTSNNTGGQLLQISKAVSFSDLHGDATILSFFPGIEILMDPTFPGVSPVQLSSDGELDDYSLVTLSGWGPRWLNDTGSVFNMKEVEVKVVNRYLCIRLIGIRDLKDRSIEDLLYCGGGRLLLGEGSIGLAELGGPAIHNGTQYGIIMDLYFPQQMGEYPAIIIKMTPDRREWIRTVTGV